MKKNQEESGAYENCPGMSDSEILSSAQECGILTASDISKIVFMNKKKKLLTVHPYAIWQGKGNDTRWKTWVQDNSRLDKRRRISAHSEKELFDYLYKYYFANDIFYAHCTLIDIYEEWLNFKITTSKSPNTPYRLDSDFKRFYLNEPVSLKILMTPLQKLTVADIKEWAFALIKKRDLTHAAWMNARTVLKQAYDYLMDKGLMETNPVLKVQIPRGFCRRNPKKPAETQIFYTDEIEKLSREAMKKADETGDTGFLAIPLFFQTGMRIGECLALTFNDIDRAKNIIRVNKMVIAKTERLPDGKWSKRTYEVVDYLKSNGDEREVVVPNSCIRIIDRIQALQYRKRMLETNLFPGATPSNIQFKMYRLCDALGIKRRSPHKGRKTYISTLLNDGFDVDFVREQVGHKELQTTLNCYTYSTTRREEQVEKLQKSLVL